MSVNEKIEQAIGELFSGNVWPLKCPYDSAPDTYAIYNPEIEEPGYYADDAKGNSKKAKRERLYRYGNLHKLRKRNRLQSFMH